MEALAAIIDLAFNAKDPELQGRAARHLRRLGIKVKLSAALRIAA